jgi:phosphoribosylaminoimidazole-succinocarboxamide synthase
MEKRDLIYEGKAKRVYTTDNPDLVIQYFKDDATAFNAKKRGTIVSKGIINNELSETFFRLLEGEGVPTHFVERLNEREMLVKRLDIIPVETVVRNIIAGSLAKRLGLEEGKTLPAPIVEYYYKNDALDDPMINQWHVTVLGMATERELQTLTDMALKINTVLRAFLERRGILLVDFKLEFGRHHGQLLLGDEICPDTCRLWDAATRKKLDKDRFRQDLGGVEEAYHEVHRRVCTAA